MYIRIVEITAPTKLQLNIFLDYLRFTHFPKNLEQGQTSAKVFRVNECHRLLLLNLKIRNLQIKLKL